MTMSGKSWESEVALFLLALFIFVAIAILAADRVDLAHAIHGPIFA
jgi:Mn2+/Fe2+ NRAMP family transporter